MNGPRLLVAGIGNIFLGDDAFGVEVVRELAREALPEGVRVVDYGIRGFDLAYGLTDGLDGAILVDAMARGGSPGTLYVVEPELPVEAGVAVETHAMHPAKVLLLARSLGGLCPWVRIVGCEPLTFGSEEEPAMDLSEPVRRAVSEAVRMIVELIRIFIDRR